MPLSRWRKRTAILSQTKILAKAAAGGIVNIRKSTPGPASFAPSDPVNNPSSVSVIEQRNLPRIAQTEIRHKELNEVIGADIAIGVQIARSHYIECLVIDRFLR